MELKLQLASRRRALVNRHKLIVNKLVTTAIMLILALAFWNIVHTDDGTHNFNSGQ